MYQLYNKVIKCYLRNYQNYKNHKNNKINNNYNLSINIHNH